MVECKYVCTLPDVSYAAWVLPGVYKNEGLPSGLNATSTIDVYNSFEQEWDNYAENLQQSRTRLGYFSITLECFTNAKLP